MRYAAGLVMVVLGAMVVGALGAVGESGATQPSTQADVKMLRTENEELRRQVAELKKQVDGLLAENAKLKKQWNDAVRNGTGGAAAPAGGDGAGKTGGSGTGAAAKADRNEEQDGPGLYRVSAGPGGKYTTTVRAKSREEAISKGISTVGKTATDFDENVEIGSLKVEKIGP